MKKLQRKLYFAISIVLVFLLVSCTKNSRMNQADTDLFKKLIREKVAGSPIVVDNSKIIKKCGQIWNGEVVKCDFNGDGNIDCAGLFVKIDDDGKGKLLCEENFAIVLKKENGENALSVFPIATYSIDTFDITNVDMRHYLVPMNTDHTEMMTKNLAAKGSCSLFVSDCSGESILYYYDSQGMARSVVIDERADDVE